MSDKEELLGHYIEELSRLDAEIELAVSNNMRTDEVYFRQVKKVLEAKVEKLRASIK